MHSLLVKSKLEMLGRHKRPSGDVRARTDFRHPYAGRWFCLGPASEPWPLPIECCLCTTSACSKDLSLKTCVQNVCYACPLPVNSFLGCTPSAERVDELKQADDSFFRPQCQNGLAAFACRTLLRPAHASHDQSQSGPDREAAYQLWNNHLSLRR